MDNMTIEWQKGPDGEMTEPPWDQLYMPEYADTFQEARRSYNQSEVNLRKLPPGTTEGMLF